MANRSYWKNHPQKGNKAKQVYFFFAALILIFGCVAIAPQALTPKLIPIHIRKTDRIMIIAPHPDDETVGPGGLIRYAVEHKVPVIVVMMTNGDGYRKSVETLFKTKNPTPKEYQKLGTIRHLETLRAMKALGLKNKDVIFLSYPDGGTNTLYDNSWDCDQLYKGVNGSTHAPYSFAYEKNAPYCGENVVKNLENIIKTFKPTAVFNPDPGDDHHDHWATGAFATYTFVKMGYKGKQYTYLVHKGTSWPVPLEYRPKLSLEPPKSLVGFGEKWFGFSLSPSEKKLKLKALRKYVTQKRMMDPFLEAFVRKNEVFARFPALKVDSSKKLPRFFSGKTFPDKVFRDPANDDIIKEFLTSGDLTNVGLVYNKKYLWIALQTQKDISPVVAYGFHIRLFGKTGIRRIDIKVLGGRIHSEKLAKNSIMYDSIIPFETADDRIVVQLPASIFNDSVNNFMLSLDTIDLKNARRIDKTAWRIFKL